MERVTRKNGITRYRESIYVGNKKLNSPYFTKITDARAWKNRFETEKYSILAHGNSIHKPKEMILADYANNWLNFHIKTSCTTKTYLCYFSILKVHIIPSFGSYLLTEITENDGLCFLERLKKTHNPKGVLNIWQVLKTILLRAKREKLILSNPFENIRKPRTELRGEVFWEKQEITQFLNCMINDPLYPLYFIALHTGMRLAELCGLKWDRVDFSINQILVTRTRDKHGLRDTTKNKMRRVIPMTSEVRAILVKLHNKQNQISPYVFTFKGKEIDYGHVYRFFQIAQKNATMIKKIRFHDLRHTFATNYMMNGGNVFELQKILGHTKIDMTLRYAHFSPTHLQSSTKFMVMCNEINTEALPQLRGHEHILIKYK